MTSSEKSLWETGMVFYCILTLMIVVPAIIRVTVKIRQDVKHYLEWSDRDPSERSVAIENAIEGQDSQFVFGQNGPEPSVQYQGRNPSLQDASNAVPENRELDAGNLPITESERAFNMDVFAANQIRQGAALPDSFPPRNESSPPPPNLRQSTDEQIRMVMAASMLTAQAEEEKRMHQVTAESQQNGVVGLSNNDTEPSMMRSGSVSMTGFWAKGKGVSSAALATMFSQSDSECTICFEDYQIGDIIVKLKCGHQLHKQCAKEWLSENPTCPVCRMNVLRPGS